MPMLEQLGAVIRQSTTTDNPSLIKRDTSRIRVAIITNLTETANVPHFTMQLESAFLPEGHQLSEALQVVVWCGQVDVVVSEPNYNIHAAADTLHEALCEFGRTLVTDYEMLRERQSDLEAYLIGELAFLRRLLGVTD